MRREAIIGLALAGLTLVWQAPAAGAEALTLEALPVSAGAVELRWNQGVGHRLERQAKGGAFEEVGRMTLTCGTVENVPMRSYLDRGLAADTEYTYRFAVPNGWHYDFGPQNVPPANDHLRVSSTNLYTDAKGYGFEKPAKGEGAHNPPSTPRELSFVGGGRPSSKACRTVIIGSGPEVQTGEILSSMAPK